MLTGEGRRPRAGWNRLRRVATEATLLCGAYALDLVVWNRDRGLVTGGYAPMWLVPVGAAVAVAALLLRHRMPSRVLAAQIAWSAGSAVLLTDYTYFTGLLIALQAIAARREPGRSVAGLLAAAVPFGVHAYRVAADVGDWLVGFTLLMLVAGAAWLLGHRTRRSDERAARLDAQRIAAAAHAVRAERLRIARELHDIVANAVSVMVLQAAGGRAVLSTDPGRTGEALAAIEEIGVQSMGELRRLLGLLRAASAGVRDGDHADRVDEVDPMGEPGVTLDRIDDLVTGARTAGLVVDLQIDGGPGRVDPSVSRTAYRVVQEALTNTLKHVGAGASVRIRLSWSRDNLAVAVEDTRPTTPGRAAPPDRRLSTGNGLVGLRERVTIAGGSLRAEQLPTGFLVHVLLPVATDRERVTPSVPTEVSL